MASVATQTALDKFLAEIDAHTQNHPAPEWLAQKQGEAREVVARLGFPTVRDEEWKYTDITPAVNLVNTPLARHALNGAAKVASQGVSEADLPLLDLPGHRLVFINGHLAPEFSAVSDLPEGVTIASLAQTINNQSEILPEHFGRYVDSQNEVFTALNTAFTPDGAFVRIPANATLIEPIHLLYFTVGSGENAPIVHPRNLFLLGDNSSAMVIETYAGTPDSVYFVNAVTEVAAGSNSRLEHVKVQRESEKAFHIGTMNISAARDVVASSHSINLGGRLVRNNVTALMGDTNSEITLNGLVLAHGEQHIDNHTSMDHAMPHCASHEVYAHVLDDKSNGVFNGKIFVRLDAQKTDAKQSNRSLLLSRDAQINAKPQLEIFADDVKCTHGATIGQLDDAALFYLRARGVPKREARAILVRAFAAEALEGISLEPLRDALEIEISQRLS